jgi:hypothetical protein
MLTGGYKNLKNACQFGQRKKTQEPEMRKNIEKNKFNKIEIFLIMLTNVSFGFPSCPSDWLLRLLFLPHTNNALLCKTLNQLFKKKFRSLFNFFFADLSFPPQLTSFFEG